MDALMNKCRTILVIFTLVAAVAGCDQGGHEHHASSSPHHGESAAEEFPKGPRGGKLLVYLGWSDAALTARMSIDYVERVYAHDPTARDDVRLFMLPGVLHCAGGRGP